MNVTQKVDIINVSSDIVKQNDWGENTLPSTNTSFHVMITILVPHSASTQVTCPILLLVRVRLAGSGSLLKAIQEMLLASYIKIPSFIIFSLTQYVLGTRMCGYLFLIKARV